MSHTLARLKGRPDRLRRARRYAGYCLTAALAVSASNPVTAAEVSRRPQPLALTIAILDLAEAPDLSPAPPPEPVRPAWRTSFGSERQTETEIKPDAGSGPLAALADSDAVLIQGVKAAAPLRRLFPPRTWRLIVSRRIIKPDDATAVAGADATSADLPAATAIAVKARQSLRVTARALALRLDLTPPPTDDETADTSPEAAVPATTPSSIPASTSAAATAVRLVERGRTLWIASVALPASCGNGGEPAQCPAWTELEAWRSAKRGAGEATLIGGRLLGKKTAAPEAQTPQACVLHGIESDLQSQILPPPEAIRVSQTGTGCISIARIGG